MRIRCIKPEFWHDEQIASWPAITRLAYIGLWNVADDAGRLRANPDYLRAQLFPYDPLVDMAAVLRPIVESGKLAPYQDRGENYGQLANFSRHQVINKPSKSKLPPPPDFQHDTGQLPEDSRMTPVVVPGGLEQGKEQGKETKGAASPAVLVNFVAPSSKPAGSVVPMNLDTEAFAAAWLDWKAHCREIRHPVKPTQEKAVLNKLASMGADRAVTAIRHTIFKGWQGIREPDPTETRQHAQPHLANDPTKRQEPANWRELIRIHQGDHGPAMNLADGNRDWLQFVRSERELIIALINAIPFDQRRQA